MTKYIDPRSLSGKFQRRILRAIREMGVELIIKTYDRKMINDREVIEVSIRAEIPKELMKILKKHGVKLSNKELRAFVSPVIIWDIVRGEEIEEIPLGTSIDGNYIVTVPLGKICTNDYLIAGYLGLIKNDALWIDAINLSDELDKMGFIEIEGIPLASFSRGKIEDFARLIARKTIGERYVADVLDFLLKKEDLGADEELPLYSKEIASIKDLFKWRTVLIDESGEFSGKNVFIDLVDVPRIVLWMTLIAGILSDKRIIILSINNLDKEIMELLSMRKEFIILSNDCSTNRFDAKIIKRNEGDYLLYRFGWFEKKRVVMKEKFIPLFKAVERVENG